MGRANKYIEEQSPWSLAKEPTRQEQLDGVLYSLAETLRVVAAALVPFLVETPERIYAQLGLEAGHLRAAPWDELVLWGGLTPGIVIERGQPLFPRVEAQ